MIRKNILLAMATGIIASTAIVTAQPPAPLDVQIVFRGDAIDSLNGASTSAEFDTIAVTPNEATVYLFDSISTFDGLFSYTASTPAVFASEAQLSANTNASAGDLDADATNLYVSMFDSTAAKQTIWRIPHSGFAGAVSMVDTIGSLTVNMDELEVDDAGSRLIISYNDTFSAAAEDVVTVPLTATAATPTLIASEATIEAALATITGYVDDTNNDLDLYDLTVQSDGDIIISQGFSSNRQINGSLLRITSAGAVSVFRTADQIITAAGADPNLVDIGSVHVEALSADEILIVVGFTSASGVLGPFIAVVSADGTTQTALATEAQCTADADIVTAGTGLIPASQFLFRFDGKSAGDVATDDDFYFFRQASPSTSAPIAENAVLRLTGVRSFLTASVGEWSMY